jgi:integrase
MSGVRRAVGREGWEGWASATVGGRRVRQHIRGRTRAEVNEAIRKVEAEWDENSSGEVLPGGDRVALAEWMSTWAAGRASAVRPSTGVGYRLDQRHINRVLGDVQLRRLTPEHVEKLYADMAARGLSAGTILHVRRTLSAALSTAVARGRIGRNVVKLASVPRYDPEEIEPLTVDEAQAVVKAVAGRRNGVRWLIALALGLRRGEVLGLQWPDIDWNAGTISVRRALQRRPWQHGCSEDAPCGQRRARDCPHAVAGGLVAAPTKTRSSRRVLALPEPLALALAEHRRVQVEEQAAAAELWRDGDWVFATEIGTPIDPRNDLREWHQVVHAAGIRRVRIHDLRHTSATLQLVAGTDSRTLQGLFGWSSPVLVARYAHVIEQAKRDAAQRIGEVLWA